MISTASSDRSDGWSHHPAAPHILWRGPGIIARVQRAFARVGGLGCKVRMCRWRYRWCSKFQRDSFGRGSAGRAGYSRQRRAGRQNRVAIMTNITSKMQRRTSTEGAARKLITGDHAPWSRNSGGCRRAFRAIVA
jgi:hypothetical protein